MSTKSGRICEKRGESSGGGLPVGRILKNAALRRMNDPSTYNWTTDGRKKSANDDSLSVGGDVFDSTDNLVGRILGNVGVDDNRTNHKSAEILQMFSDGSKVRGTGE